MPLKDSIAKVTDSVKSTVSSSAKRTDVKYESNTNNTSMSTNPKVSKDARDVARQSERLKEKALKDADRRL
jgi:hypothetical protein